MLRECHLCGEEITNNTSLCPNCGATLNAEPDVISAYATATAFEWRVRCPFDGHEIVVDGPNSRVASCPACLDEMDSKEISHVHPIRVALESADLTPACAEVETEVNASNCQAVPVIILTDLISNERININNSGVIGRIGNVAPEVFSKSKYVSEMHCRVILEDRTWLVEHIGQNNPTKVNGVAISRKVRVPLRDGDYLTLANLIYEVKIPACQPVSTVAATPTRRANPAQSTNLSVDKVAESAVTDIPDVAWQITCPLCGHTETVPDESSLITECPFCDEYDKYEIKQVKAVRRSVG